MTDTRAQLLTRKADLLAALRLIEQDYHDGNVDEEAYRAARRRYEEEAAAVLERLDTLASDESAAGRSGRDQPQGAVKHRPDGEPMVPRWAFVGGAGALVIAAMVVFLVLALQPRSGDRPITGRSNATPPPSPRLLAAQQQVRAHPRSLDALVNLGNAYLNNGQVSLADRAYQAAMKLDPAAPQPATLHAMIEGYGGQGEAALAVLHQVERDHPTYSGAWLLDGVFSVRNHRSYAIAAWQHFLALAPNSPQAATVRGWIVRARQAHKLKK